MKKCISRLSRSSSLVCFLYLFFSSCILYFSTFFFDEFVLDDDYYIFKNPHILSLELSSLWGRFLSFKTPIPNIIWSLSSFLSEANQRFTLRLINILVHSLNAFLVFSCLRLFIKLKIIQNLEYLPALTAILFLAYPVNVETVAWFSGLRGLLSLLFSLLSVLFHLMIRQRSLHSYHPLTFIFLILALLSKQDAIATPFIILLIDFFFFKATKKSISGFFFFSIAATLTFCFFQLAGSNFTSFSNIFEYTVSERLHLALNTLSYYAFHFILPFNTTFGSAYTIDETLKAMIKSYSFLYPIFFSLIFTATFFFIKNKKISLQRVFPFAMILITLIPFSGLIPFPFQATSITSSRYMYFGSTFAAFVISYLLLTKLHRPLTYLILLIFTLTSLYNINQWQKSSYIFSSALNKNPENYNLRISLAASYLKEKNYRKVQETLSYFLKDFRKTSLMFAYYAPAIDATSSIDEKKKFLVFAGPYLFSMSNKTKLVIANISIDCEEGTLPSSILNDSSTHKEFPVETARLKVKLRELDRRKSYLYLNGLAESYFAQKSYKKAFELYKESIKYRTGREAPMLNYESLKAFFE